MRLCGIDIESTGLSTIDDQITEIAWIIKDAGDPKPLAMKTHFVLPPGGEFTEGYLTPQIQRLTKITKKHVLCGKDLQEVLADLALDLEGFHVDCIVAHNGEMFDRPFIRAKAKALGLSSMDEALVKLENRLWVDTSVDCVYPEDCRYTNLVFVAAYFGFLNPFSHSALFDVATMLKVLDQFELGPVVERAKSPWAVVKACVPYNDRQLAKNRRYSWETLGEKSYPKTWVKKIKELDLAKEQAEAGFEVVRIA